MKVELPSELKSAVPPTFFGRLLAATPVVMAVVATMLAGLSSSEMTRAQYDRSLAAQQQSKAGDQWAFFQAKRLRGAYQANTAELLQTITEVRALDLAALRAAAGADRDVAALFDSPGTASALAFLQRGEVPRPTTARATDPKVKVALEAMDRPAPDSEMAGLLAGMADETLETALRAAREQSDAFDAGTKPVNALVDRLDACLAASAATFEAPAGRSIRRDFAAARFRYLAARYEVEARLNQSIAGLYELQVRKSNFSAERHHARSQSFFYGMLGAQLGVIVATFAMAARQRNLLWSLAAGAGLLAVAFGVYVYLYT